jgi:hypothetical protein
MVTGKRKMEAHISQMLFAHQVIVNIIGICFCRPKILNFSTSSEGFKLSHMIGKVFLPHEFRSNV